MSLIRHVCQVQYVQCVCPCVCVEVCACATNECTHKWHELQFIEQKREKKERERSEARQENDAQGAQGRSVCSVHSVARRTSIFPCLHWPAAATAKCISLIKYGIWWEQKALAASISNENFLNFWNLNWKIFKRRGTPVETLSNGKPNAGTVVHNWQ